jgi:hypothetical protein
MLIFALVVPGLLAIAGLLAFAVLCLGIRREDKAASFQGKAPGFAVRQARRFTGLRSPAAGPSTSREQAANTARARARADV